MKTLGLCWIILLSVIPSGLGGAQSSRFILLASTIGPIDSGIVDLLENEFEKETGIRVRHVGAGTGAHWISPERGMSISSWSMRNPSKKNL